MGGESACLMQQPFSYASGISNESKEGNPIHALGQSVSFGRFMTESLAWEKWSTFSHNKYVEEAERFARPGSVAQKKAFFEAHYREVAARKAAAAALLEQASDADASSKTDQGEVDNIPTTDVKALQAKTTDHVLKIENVLVEKNVNVESPNQLRHGNRKEEEVKAMELKGATKMETCAEVKNSEGEITDSKLSAATKMEKPPQLKSSINYGRASKQPSSPAKPDTMATPMRKKSVVDLPDKKRPTPKSIHKSIYLTPAREINRLASSIIRKIDGSKLGSNSKTSKDFSTPLRTPTTASMNRVASHPLTTPCSENKNFRAKTPLEPSTFGNKTVRARWHFLPTEIKSQSPNLSTPFRLRTEERAARRKEKLEEKFNASQAQKAAQQQATIKEKAEAELRKLRQSLCFKARPLPDFYKERATTPKNQTKKVPLTQLESPKLGRTPTLSAVHRKPSNPPQKTSTKNNISEHALEKHMHNSFSHLKIYQNYS